MKRLQYWRLMCIILMLPLILAIPVASLLVVPKPALAADPGDNYPTQWRDPVAQDTVVDTWREWNRECTSWASFALSDRNNYQIPFHDYAYNWSADAAAINKPTNNTPAVGAIAWWAAGAPGASQWGHVAWVSNVDSSGGITIEQYNGDSTGHYTPGPIYFAKGSSSWPTGFIHFKDINNTVGDWDADGKTNLTVFRPSNGTWHWYNGGEVIQGWGLAGDIPVPAWYSSTGTLDYAVFRPSNSTWYVQPQGASSYSQSFGQSGDIPVPGDYDGDGKTNYAVFRPSDSTWHWYSGGEVIQQFGQSGDIPVPAKWDGGGKTEPGVFRPSDGTWHYLSPTGGEVIQQFGQSGDIPEPGYYSGSSKPDFGLFRPSNSTWYWFPQGGSGNSQPFGLSGDIPVPGNFSGSPKTDLGLFRPSNSTWYWLPIGGGSSSQGFGLSGDIPAITTLPYPLLHQLGLL